MSDTSSTRQLRRATQRGVLGGVAAGLARYFRIDVVIVRIVFIASLFVGGIGIIAYIAAWLLVPDEDGRTAIRLGTGDARSDDLGRVAGVVLIFLAAMLVVSHWSWTGDIGVPVLLIGAGTWLLVRRAGDAPPSEASPGETPVAPDVVGDDTGERTSGPADVDTIAAPPATASSTRGPSGPPVAQVTVALVVIAAGLLGLAAAAWPELTLRASLAVCLAITGGGLVVGAFVGRGRSLIGLGIVLLSALSLTAAVDVDLRGGVGERRYTPSSLADVDDEYRLGLGEMIIDLRDLRADELRGQRVPVDASISAGSLEIFVPQGVRVEGTADARLGDLDVFGLTEEGAGPEIDIERDGPEGAGVIVIEASVGAGEIVIR